MRLQDDTASKLAVTTSPLCDPSSTRPAMGSGVRGTSFPSRQTTAAVAPAASARRCASVSLNPTCPGASGPTPTVVQPPPASVSEPAEGWPLHPLSASTINATATDRVFTGSAWGRVPSTASGTSVRPCRPGETAAGAGTRRPATAVSAPSVAFAAATGPSSPSRARGRRRRGQPSSDGFPLLADPYARRPARATSPLPSPRSQSRRRVGMGCGRRQSTSVVTGQA